MVDTHGHDQASRNACSWVSHTRTDHSSMRNAIFCHSQHQALQRSDCITPSARLLREHVKISATSSRNSGTLDSRRSLTPRPPSPEPSRPARYVFLVSLISSSRTFSDVARKMSFFHRRYNGPSFATTYLFNRARLGTLKLSR